VVLDPHGDADADVTDIVGGYGAWSGTGLPVAAGTGGAAMDAETVPEVSAEEGHRLVEAGAVLLDVREADEWEAGHSPEATWIPLGEVQARVAELPRDGRIVAICRSGSRSLAVAAALAQAGYDAVNLDGGMRAWAAEDYDVVASDGLPGVVI
jgi:rhodanese-related sulfurtransferase